MTIISPLQQPKPTISMKSKHINTRTMDCERPNNEMNEYTLFLVLEKQRNESLRDLYRGKRLGTSEKNDIATHEDTHRAALPKFPPRYQCLDLSAQWFIKEMSNQNRGATPSGAKDQFKALEPVTKMFLQDMVNILRGLDSGIKAHGHRSTPPCIPTLRVKTITPPSSPLTLPQVVSEDSQMLQDRPTEARRREVDITDDEILSLWNCTEPCVDGIDLDISL